jgi:hypothetical protein
MTFLVVDYAASMPRIVINSPAALQKKIGQLRTRRLGRGQ